MRFFFFPRYKLSAFPVDWSVARADFAHTNISFCTLIATQKIY